MEPQTASLIAMIAMGILGLMAGRAVGFYQGYDRAVDDAAAQTKTPDYLALRLSRDTRQNMEQAE